MNEQGMGRIATRVYRRQAFQRGQEAVRSKPVIAPQNPYDEIDEPQQYEQWDAGADSAGICEIYTNGILNKAERT